MKLTKSIITATLLCTLSLQANAAADSIFCMYSLDNAENLVQQNAGFNVLIANESHKQIDAQITNLNYANVLLFSNSYCVFHSDVQRELTFRLSFPKTGAFISKEAVHRNRGTATIQDDATTPPGVSVSINE